MANVSTLHYWTGTAWSTEESNKIKARVIDRVHKPKFTEITIADPTGSIQNSGNYSAYKRVKLVDFYTNTEGTSFPYSFPIGLYNEAKVIFFGRVEFVDARNDLTLGPILVLQCRSFLQELSEEGPGVDFSGCSTLGELVKDIIDYYIYTEVTYSGTGGFTVQEYDNKGYWVSTGTGGRARLIYVDTATKTLVLTDVFGAEYFINGATLTEYTDPGCSSASGISDTQSGALVHNIDTSSIGAIGAIDTNTTKNCFRDSRSPLDLITNLCLMGSSTGVYDFYLDEALDSSLYPPVFKLFLRSSLPTGGPLTNGLTIQLNGTPGNQVREMHSDYSFPLPEKEIYTEAEAFSTDSSNSLIESVKKAGSVSFQLKTFKKRSYGAPEHYTQAGLDNSVDRFIAMTGTASIQRGNVTIVYYPTYYISPNYYIVNTGEKVRVINDQITYAQSPGVDMLVIETDYEEPPGTSRIQLLDETAGIGPPEYVYPNDRVVTEFPRSIDPRTIDEITVPDWETILPKAIQGYHHDVTFTADDQDTISIVAGEVKFYDGTSLSIDYISSSGNTTYDLPTDSIYYIYFDLDIAQTNVLQLTTDYLSVIDEKTGLVCLAQKGSASGIKATIIPSYGKEPLLTPDVIDMTGLKEYDYGGGTKLQALLSTQIQSGHIFLSAATNFDTGYNPYEKAKVFFQGSVTGIPVSISVGDLWIDSDDGNKLYRAYIIGADEIKTGEWEEATPAGTPEVYTGSTPPADTSLLWIDTSVEPNVLRRYASGEGPFYEQQERNTTTYLNMYAGSSYIIVGQRRPIFNERIITKLGFWAWRIGTVSGDVTYTIKRWSDGYDFGSISFPVSSLSETAYTYYEATFASPVTASGELALCIEYSGGTDTSNCVRVAYANVDYKTEEYQVTNNGTAWANYTTYDTAYKMTYTGGWVTVDPVDIDYSGVVLDATKGMNIYGRDMAFTTSATKWGTPQCYVGSDGKFYAGGGAVYLDSTGLKLYAGAVQTGWLKSDGTGWLGTSGSISWTAAGVLTVAAANVSGTLTAATIAATQISAGSLAAGVILTSSITASQISTQIVNAQIASIDFAKVTNVVIDVGDVGDGSTNSDWKFRAYGSIQTSNYSSGSTGWRILGNGDAEFNDVTVRGTVYATAGEFAGTLKATTLYTGTTLTVSGTISGGGGAVTITSSGLTITGATLTLKSSGGTYSGYLYVDTSGRLVCSAWDILHRHIRPITDNVYWLGDTTYAYAALAVLGTVQYVSFGAGAEWRLANRANGSLLMSHLGRASNTSGEIWEANDFGWRVNSSGDVYAKNRMGGYRESRWVMSNNP